MACLSKDNQTARWRSILLFFAAISLLCCCNSKHAPTKATQANEKAYFYHYRNLDSTIYYAKIALAEGDANDRSEALNHLAFVATARMDYDSAATLLSAAKNESTDVIESLIANVQLMRLCQRQSRNKDFYTYREAALRGLRRMSKEPKYRLSLHAQKRLAYARSEFKLVSSAYFYYVGLLSEAASSLKDFHQIPAIENDTAQQLNYLYNVGSGGIITSDNASYTNLCEFDSLFACYVQAQQHDITFFAAQAMQGLSEHLQSTSAREELQIQRPQAMRYLNRDNMPDSMLAGNLAQRALDLFSAYGDIYQKAGGYRTLAECYWALRDYDGALHCLQEALSDTLINRAPDLVASIDEQLSLAFSALDDKPSSDYSRNLYLDLQEMTRQDRQLEARAEQLRQTARQQNWMIGAVAAMIALVTVLLLIFHQMRRRSNARFSMEKLIEPLKQWRANTQREDHAAAERYEEAMEQIQLTELQILNNKKRNLEQRAKVSLVNSITPFIDRMCNEAKHLADQSESDAVKQERYAYLRELCDNINAYNDVLTQWIQMRQGQLSLHIESFALQDLFDIVQKGRMGFQMNGINLTIQPTNLWIKADKTLTLFMINTIADNARKFTPSGGTVTIAAELKNERTVEISVTDTGTGLSPEELSTVFDHKMIAAAEVEVATKDGKARSHGFGLKNCKGIIEKYKKISQIFSDCSIGATSEKGKGSRFFFHLPQGAAHIILALLLFAVPLHAKQPSDFNKNIQQAAAFADSAYYSNINGTFRYTLQMADSCRMYLNRAYNLKRYDADTLVRTSEQATQPPELQWFNDSVPIDFNIILNMRNESAVAALALHEWDLYHYNNKVYTRLFREMSADKDFSKYVRVMQRSESTRGVAVALLLGLLIAIFPAYYFIYYRKHIYDQFCIERIGAINEVLLGNASATEKLQDIEGIWKKIKRAPSPTLSSIVAQIKDSLRNHIQLEQKQQMSLSLADDDLHRAEYESDKLYIANSVLDNCLSTLKHETMYYPSRISQLIDGTNAHIDDLQALVEYYKELYTLLSAQATRQTEETALRSKRLTLGELNIGNLSDSDAQLQTIGDQDMLTLLFEILRKKNGAPLTPQISIKDDRYIRLRIPMNLSLTPEECQNLFTPLTSDFDYLLCRQIIRDVGEVTHARGCGIQASHENGKANVVIDLAKI